MERPPKKPGGNCLIGEGGVLKDKVSGGEYVLECPPKKPGGICCARASNDKKISGEYVLSRPPKKPGGWQVVMLLLCGVIKCVEGNSDYKNRDLNGGAFGSVMRGWPFAMLVGCLLLGLLLFRKKARKSWKIFGLRLRLCKYSIRNL